MKTNFKNLNDLKTNIEEGQEVYIENFCTPHFSRSTKVIRKQSYFFTTERNGKESWIINGATEFKHFGFSFLPEQERVNIFWKKDSKPFVSLYFNDTIIQGKKSIIPQTIEA